MTKPTKRRWLFRNYDFVLGFAAALSLVAVVLVFLSHSSGPVTTTELAPSSGINWDNWLYDPISVFTFVLAFSTIGLWISTHKTAKIAERALTEVEAPFLVVDVTEPGLDVSDGMATSSGKPFAFRVVNYGRTPAKLIELKTDWKVEDAPASPDPLDSSEMKGRSLPAGVVSAPNNPYDERQILVSQVDISMLSEESAWKNYRFFFLGFVRYEDIFGVHYVVGFCHVFDGLRGRFVRIGDHRYNYVRRDP